MYFIILDEGIAAREFDGKIVAPATSNQEPDFRAYIEWVESGNQPTIYNSRPEGLVTY